MMLIKCVFIFTGDVGSDAMIETIIINTPSFVVITLNSAILPDRGRRKKAGS